MKKIFKVTVVVFYAFIFFFIVADWNRSRTVVEVVIEREDPMSSTKDVLDEDLYLKINSPEEALDWIIKTDGEIKTYFKFDEAIASKAKEFQKTARRLKKELRSATDAAKAEVKAKIGNLVEKNRIFVDDCNNKFQALKIAEKKSHI